MDFHAKLSPAQKKFILDFGLNRNWQGFWNGDLYKREHVTARALKHGGYLYHKFYEDLQAWRFEWTEWARQESTNYEQT